MGKEGLNKLAGEFQEEYEVSAEKKEHDHKLGGEVWYD